MNRYTTITRRQPPTVSRLRRAATLQLRRAVTVIEVLFAMGVILIGLMGVAALVPVAGRDAAASLHADIAGRVAAGATAELNAQGLNHLTGVVIANNEARPADSLSLSIGAGSTSASLASVIATLSSPGVLPNSGLLRASYCIDPSMVSTLQPFGAFSDSGSRNAYQPLRFPYYSEFYDPVAAPNAAITVPGTAFPRMYRVGFGPGLVSSGQPFRSAMVGQRIADGQVGLGLTHPKDDALPASQVLRPTATGVVGARETLGDFNWIATLTPPVGSGNLYKLSVVALSGRSPDPGFVGGAPYAVTNAFTNPDSEKLLWIADAVSLGSTTEVLVYGSTAIQDDVIPGQWVMLSMQPRDGAGVPSGPAVHQWYRVVQATEPEKGPFNQPPRGALADDVWRRRVVLDGPTWTFAFGNASVFDDTYMTVVDGAIGVIESQVLIQ